MLRVRHLDIERAPGLIGLEARRTRRPGARRRGSATGSEHDDTPWSVLRGREDHRDGLVAGVGGEGALDRVAGRIEAERHEVLRARKRTIHGRLRRTEGLRGPGDYVADREAATAGNKQEGEGRAVDADGDGSARRRAMSPLRSSEASLGSGHSSPPPLYRGTRRYPRSSFSVNGNS